MFAPVRVGSRRVRSVSRFAFGQICFGGFNYFAIITMYMRIWFCMLICVWAPNWFDEGTLGKGHHAETQLKHAAGKCFKNLKTLIANKVLVKGPRYKTRFAQYYKLRACVAFLLGVSIKTVRRSVEFLKNNSQNTALPKTNKSGRKKLTKEQYQQ